MEGTIKSPFVSPDSTKSRRCLVLVPINPSPPGALERMKMFFLLSNEVHSQSSLQPEQHLEASGRVKVSSLCRVCEFALGQSSPCWVSASLWNSSHLPKLPLGLLNLRIKPDFAKRAIFDDPEGVFFLSMFTHPPLGLLSLGLHPDKALTPFPAQ